MIEAYPNKDGTYYLDGKTYYLKEKIKSLGGKWDGRRWNIPKEAIEKIGAIEMFWVHHDAYCHESEGMTFASMAEINRGWKQMGCGYCDTYATYGPKVRIWQDTKKEE